MRNAFFAFVVLILLSAVFDANTKTVEIAPIPSHTISEPQFEPEAAGTLRLPSDPIPYGECSNWTWSCEWILET